MTFHIEYHVNFTQSFLLDKEHTQKHPDTQFTAIILAPGS